MKLFISYASADRARCRQIVELLSLAHEPWFDRRITLGIEWPKEIASRITESDAVVWLISAESLASPNCQEEIELARTLRKPILPLLLESSAPVPEFLRRYEHVDLSESLGNFHLVLSGLSVLERQTLRGDRMETGGSTHRVLRRETAVILHSGSSSANMIRILTPSLGSSGWNVVPFDLSRGPTLIAQLPDRTSIIVVILDVHVYDLMARLAELAPPAEIPAVPLYVGPFTLPPAAPPALRELVSQPGIELPTDVAGIDQLTIRRLVTLMNDRIMAHARRALKTNSGSAPRQRSQAMGTAAP